MKTDVHTLFSTLRQLESTGSSSPQFCTGMGLLMACLIKKVGGFGLVARCLAHCVLPEVSRTEAGIVIVRGLVNPGG